MYQALPSAPVSSSMKYSVLLSTWPWPTGVGLLYSANETPGVEAVDGGIGGLGGGGQAKRGECGGKTGLHEQLPFLRIRACRRTCRVILGPRVVRRNTADRGVVGPKRPVPTPSTATG